MEFNGFQAMQYGGASNASFMEVMQYRQQIGMLQMEWKSQWE